MYNISERDIDSLSQNLLVPEDHALFKAMHNQLSVNPADLSQLREQPINNHDIQELVEFGNTIPLVTMPSPPDSMARRSQPTKLDSKKSEPCYLMNPDKSKGSHSM